MDERETGTDRHTRRLRRTTTPFPEPRMTLEIRQQNNAVRIQERTDGEYALPDSLPNYYNLMAVMHGHPA